MSRKLKRVIALSGVVAMASLGLAACSGSGSGSSADGKVNIEYVHRLPDGEGMTKVADIVKKWNADHPDIQVKATKWDGPAEELIKKLENDVKADNAPCLAQVGYSETAEVFAKGLLMDVSEYATKYKDKFNPGAFEQMAIGGKYVGLPQDTGPLVYLYNKAEFDKLGLKVPTTAAEFRETAKQAAAQGKYIGDFEPDEAPNLLSGMAAAAGSDWYTADGDAWKVNTSDEGSKTVAEFWQGLLDDKSILTGNRWDDSFKKVVTDGKLIGTIGAAWEAALLADPKDGITTQSGQWQVAQLPDLGKGKTGPDGGSGVAVLKGCKAPKQAMEFNAWFNTQIADLGTQGLVVAAKGEAKTPEAVKTFFGGQDVMAEFMKANNNTNKFAFIPGWSAVASSFTQNADAVAKGNMTVSELFEKANGDSKKALESLNLKVK